MQKTSDRAVAKAVNDLFQRISAANLTLTKVAELSGVTRVTLSNWKNHRNRPTLETYLVVLAALDEAMA